MAMHTLARITGSTQAKARGAKSLPGREAHGSILGGAARIDLWWLFQAQAELAQLLLVHRARRLGQQALPALRLRKRDHVANRLRARHQRDDPVQAERDPAVRRCAVLQVVEQKTELRTRFGFRDAERGEY